MTRQVLRDTEGYLINPDEWTDSIAIELAKEEGIQLSDHHWQVLRFMNKYYGDNNVAPDVRHVIRYLAAVNNTEKKAAKKHVFELFPYGYVQQACKISGMKRPRAWSTG